MRSLRSLVPLWIVVSVALAPRAVSANVLFPSAIQSHLNLSYTPPCTICHSSLLGGKGTVVQPFGINMRMLGGLTDPDPSTVGPALDALKAANTDSDCNGIPDIKQLTEGRDPNTGEYINGSNKTAPPSPGCGDTPAFGCGAQLAPGGAVPDDAAALAAALAAVLGLSLTRRRRPPRHPPQQRRP